MLVRATSMVSDNVSQTLLNECIKSMPVKLSSSVKLTIAFRCRLPLSSLSCKLSLLFSGVACYNSEIRWRISSSSAISWALLFFLSFMLAFLFRFHQDSKEKLELQVMINLFDP